GKGSGFHSDGPDRRPRRDGEKSYGSRSHGSSQGQGGGRDFHKRDGADRREHDSRRDSSSTRGGFRPRHDGEGRNSEHGSYGRRNGDGQRSEGQRRDGYRPRRDFDNRDGERRFNSHRDNEHRSPRRDDDNRSRGYRGDSRGDSRGEDRRGGEQRGSYRRDGGQHGNYRGGGDNRRSYDRRGNDRDNNRGNGPRHDGGQNHGEYRRHDDRGGYGERNNHHDRGDRGGYQRRDERSTEHGGDNAQRLDKPRRNSDGTISFPSQNPYTDRRPGEPKMPKGMEWSMLSKDEKERLRGLSKEHAENVGLHMLAAYSIEEEEPELALEHAKWIARQASRIDLARETLAFIAYRQGDYKLALKEFRTAYRMNGYLDYLPFMADCERGLGNPRKAIEVASSEESKQLQGDAKAEMFLVYAGALGDLGLWDKAIETVHTLSLAKALSGGYRMRAVQAEQNFLEQNGRSEDALALEPLLDKLEAQYADEDDEESSQDVAVDYDLEKLSDSELEQIGIEAEDGGFRRRS
ncbi:MAG: helicase, partial [Bifidobacterium crudilactis]|nr:helicase [Bifidobacterium crudilactis]